MDPVEIRCAVDDWPEECKKLHRQGLTVRAMVRSEDGTEIIAQATQRVETRTENPDTHGGASRPIDEEVIAQAVARWDDPA